MAARQLRRPFFRTPCEITINDKIYKVKRKLDNGSFGQVFVAHQVHEKDKLIAIKIMSHERITKTKQQKRIEEEINLHSQIDTNNIDWIYNHTGIVQLYRFDHNVNIKHKLYKCMVMEYCEGSHLNQYLRCHPSDRLEEIEAFYFFQQLIRSIQCLHKQNIIHRDIKPQNLLLAIGKDSLPILKLCDFGLAKKLSHSRSTTHSMCGTPNYVAPEIVTAEGHSYGVDIWSAGVVLYIMLVKHHQPPFETGNIQLTMAKVRDHVVKIPKYLSIECRSFLSQLLIKNKSKRITIKHLTQHIWYKRNKKKLNILLKRKLDEIDTTNLMNYNKCFKKKSCIYEIEKGSAKLSWGGPQCDDYCMDVMTDINGRITVVFGGICTKTYNIYTLPVGFYDKYTILCQFVGIQSRNTPLIAISVFDDALKENHNGFNMTHYAVLVQSHDIDYYHVINNKSKIFMQYSKERDEYIGYYDDFEANTQSSFNVMETKSIHRDDIMLFHKLKRKLLSELTLRYKDNGNTLKVPVTLQYTESRKYVLNNTFNNLFGM